jgi:hypothetical protein
VRTALVEVPSPRLDLGPGIVQRQELMRVQTFVPEPAIDGRRQWLRCIRLCKRPLFKACVIDMELLYRSLFVIYLIDKLKDIDHALELAGS